MRFKILQSKFETFENIVNKILYLYENKENENEESTVVIGIDGGGGAGKTTFAHYLRRMINEAQEIRVSIINMDDFYLPSFLRNSDPVSSELIGADFDWKRMEAQVLQPLMKNKKVRYDRYDWESDSLKKTGIISSGGIVIIEGVYSLRKELEHYYDFKIWIECPDNIRLQRGLARDGEQARGIWVNQWMAAEKKYRIKHKPDMKADLIVDGSGKHKKDN